MFAYDCLILGKEIDAQYTEDELVMLEDYLTVRGGTIIFYRGNPLMLGKEPFPFEPVRWTEEELGEMKLELTQEGVMSPVFRFGQPESDQVVIRSMRIW